jgi:hypothetical protein
MSISGVPTAAIVPANPVHGGIDGRRSTKGKPLLFGLTLARPARRWHHPRIDVYVNVN